MLNLPSTVLVNRVMPKKVFYEHLKTTAAIKEQFVQQIERIEMVASIKEASIHIPGDKDVAEIDVLALYLKGIGIPYEAIELVARSISNKLLFICLTNESCKLLVRRDRLYETGWEPTDGAKLELVGSTLGELWDSIVSQVIFGDASYTDLAGRLERKRRSEALRLELEQVERKRKSEKQIAKKNALFDRKRAIEAELSRLEGES
ncbi:hypothetical protein B5F84_03265 [Olsenella sp. An290]|nr:hypothetical protein B5F84_03265 [Olsenella sp. An290]